MEFSLKQYLNKLSNLGLLVRSSGDSCVSRVSFDSKNVEAQVMFICKGRNFKAEYLKEAIEKGASYYVAEQEYITGFPHALVTDSRKALAVAAEMQYQVNDSDLKLIGVTGTAGKTTTTYYLKHILDRFTAQKTAFLTNVERYCGTTTYPEHNTTPESLELHRLFSEAKKNDLRYLSMEVTSQGYKDQRVFGVTFDVGVFLNFGVDHIDDIEHSDLDDYFNCKLRLIQNSKLAIVNANMDKERLNAIASEAAKHKTRLVLFGNETADYFATNIEQQTDGYTFEIKNARGNSPVIKIGNKGAYNVENAVAAIAAAREMGVDWESIVQGIKKVDIPGRMTIFDFEKRRIIVDYAHNELCFRALFQSLKAEYPSQPICVVGGSAGSKNRIRRRQLGRLWGENASCVYLTAEDPDYEDPKKICIELAKYVLENGNAEIHIIPDRERAISQAMRGQQNEIIVVVGKGEERYIKLHGKSVPCASDIDVVAGELEKNRQAWSHMP